MNSSAIRRVAGLTVIACLGLLCPARFASASPSSPSLTVGAIASGVITNVHGQVDGKGEVYVFALPDQSDLIGKPAGVPIPLTLVGYARTNAHGQYTVNVRPANLMKTNGRHGYVNLEVMAVSGGKVADASYSVTAAGAAWKAEGGTNSAPSLSFNFASRFATSPPVAGTAGVSVAVAPQIPITPAAPSAAFEQLMKDTDSASAGTPASPGTHAAPNIVVCVVIPEKIYHNKPEHFLTTATTSTGNKIPETVTEGTDSSSTHTLGIGTSHENSEGKTVWSDTGTGSITDSSTHSVSVVYGYPRTIYNRVNYRDYYNNCPHAHTDREPYSFYDLLTSDGGRAPMHWYFNCGHHDAGTSWSTGHSTSATIEAGVSLGPINVSAQSGYGTSVQLTFNYHVAGEICGNNSQGPVNSSLVEADQA